MVEKFTDIELAFITSLKEEASLEWSDITDKFNKKFGKGKSLDAVKKGYQRSRDRVNSPDGFAKLMRDTARTRKANGANARDLKTIMESWDNREDILDAIKSAAKGIAKITVKPVQLPKPGRRRQGMTLELLISDVHVGKITNTFNHEVLKRRLKQISDTVVKEVQRAHRDYKIDKIIVSMLGDMIESATMHGPESTKGCEFGNSRQIEECQKQLFHLLLVPIFGIAKQIKAQVDCIGVPGNHDRTEEHRTYSNPGEHNVTWIIYNTLKEFTSLSGFKNVNWFIPTDPYHLHDIYGEGVLYEHYDNVKGSNQRTGIEHLLSKRINQLKKPIVFIRGGHFHEPMESGIGKIVINGNVPGNDGFSTTLGFDCEPSQTLNFYIEREKTDSIKRQTSFYKRFLIQLD